MLCRITSILVFVRNFSRKICETTLKIRYRKGSPVKFFEVSYYQKNFQLSTVHKSEDRGGMKMPYDFFVYICEYKSTNSWLGKKDYSLEWLANQDKCLDEHYISVSWTDTKLGPKVYFIKKIECILIFHLILNWQGQKNILRNFEQNLEDHFWENWNQASAVCLQKMC